MNKFSPNLLHYLLFQVFGRIIKHGSRTVHAHPRRREPETTHHHQSGCDRRKAIRPPAAHPLPIKQPSAAGASARPVAVRTATILLLVHSAQSESSQPDLHQHSGPEFTLRRSSGTPTDQPSAVLNPQFRLIPVEGAVAGQSLRFAVRPGHPARIAQFERIQHHSDGQDSGACQLLGDGAD